MRLKFLFFVVMAVGLLTQNADAQGRGRTPQADVQGRGDTPHPHPSKVYGYITLFDGQQRSGGQWHMTRNNEIGRNQERYSFWPAVPSASIIFRRVNGRDTYVLPLDQTTLQHPFSYYCEPYEDKAYKYEVYFILDANILTPTAHQQVPGRINNDPSGLHHPLYGRIDPNRQLPVISVTYSPDYWVFDRIEVDPVQVPTMFSLSGVRNIDPQSYIPVPLRPIQLPENEFPNEQ